MPLRRIAAVAGLAVAIAGCGADGSDVGDAGGGFFDASPVEEAPAIEVVAATDDEMHDEMADDAMHDESAEHDEMATEHDEMADAEHDEMATEHDEMADAEHDEMADEHDEMADAEHDEMADAEHDDSAMAPVDGLVVNVEMTEFGYTLDQASVPAGEPVTFRFVNTGQIEHEAMFGSDHQQEEYTQLDDHGGHGDEGHHGEIAAITVGAGDTGEMTMVFDAPGEMLIGCHLDGHWEAGMVAGFQIVTA